jgi:hypothetical protein
MTSPIVFWQATSKGVRFLLRLRRPLGCLPATALLAEILNPEVPVALAACRSGPEEFIAHVESIPTSLLDPLSPLSAGSSALAFLPRYRAFLAAYAAGDRPTAAAVLGRAVAEGLAPRSFWAVIMVDLVPLLDGAVPCTPPLKSQQALFFGPCISTRSKLTFLDCRFFADADMLIPTETAFILLGQLEDLLVNSTDDPKAYLGHLANLRQAATDDAAEEGGADESWRWRDVRKSLDVVRLALARYLARDLTLS